MLDPWVRIGFAKSCSEVDPSTLDSDHWHEILITTTRPIQKAGNILDGWVEDVHPEEHLVYSRVLSSRNLEIRVHTDLSMRDMENRTVIKGAVDRLSTLLDSSDEIHAARLENWEVEACILVRDGSQDEFGYYLVNHRDQTVFWLEEVKPRDVDVGTCAEDTYLWDQRPWRSLIAVGMPILSNISSINTHETVDQVRDKSPAVVDLKDAQTLFVCHFLLWGEPAGAMKLLDDVSPEGVISAKRWREMMIMFSKEWDKIFIQGLAVFAGGIAFITLLLQALQADYDNKVSQHPSLIALLVAPNLKRDFGGIMKDVQEAVSGLILFPARLD
ncbi:hypothetical protein FRC00_008845 [Tulasnella sp. 408]|nr:hypothetical protein FRC00_008845 [Tulasnella sp. 408]